MPRASPTRSHSPEGMEPIPQGQTPTLPTVVPSMSPPSSWGWSSNFAHSSGRGALEEAKSASQSMREGRGTPPPSSMGGR